MILIAIIALSAVVLTAVYAVLVGLPDFPSEIDEFVSWFSGIVSEATSFILSFVYPTPIAVMLGVTLSAYLVYVSYKSVMWIVKKIPMFGVSD